MNTLKTRKATYAAALVAAGALFLTACGGETTATEPVASSPATAVSEFPT